MKHTMKHKKIMITLAACAVVLAGIGGTYSVLTASTETVKNTFKPEFINRIDEIVVFRTLNDDDLKIADWKLK